LTGKVFSSTASRDRSYSSPPRADHRAADKEQPYQAGPGAGNAGILSFADVMGMDLKYLNDENYQEKKEYQENFAATHADSLILRDKGYYRVLTCGKATPIP